MLTEGGDADKLGRGCVWKGQIPYCLHQNHIFAVRVNKIILDPYFLSYQTGSDYGKTYFLNCSKQSTNLASINTTQVRQFPVLLPSLTEQRGIVKTVEVWDRAISLAERLIAAKLTLRKGLMQQLLTGKRRFPGFSEPWREVRLGEILHEVSRPVEWDDDAMYRLASVRRGSQGLFHRSTKQGREIKTKDLHTIHTDDFLISKRQVVHGATGLVTPSFDGAKVSGSYTILRARDPHMLDIEFFSWLAKLPRMVWKTYITSNGVHIEKLFFVVEDYLKQKIHLPRDVGEQRRVVELLSETDRELSLLRAQLTALKTQKRGLMQQLLTGKVRVRAPASNPVASESSLNSKPSHPTIEGPCA